MLVRVRVLYGAAAMAAGFFVYSYVQDQQLLERSEEDEDGDGETSADRVVSGQQFFAVMDRMHLDERQKAEVDKFWKNLIHMHQQKRLKLFNTAGEVETTLESIEGEDDERCVRLGEFQQFALEYKNVYPDAFPHHEVLEASKLAAEAVPMWTGLVGSTSSILVSTGKRFQDLAKGTKGGMELAMHRTIRKYLERALDVVGDRLREALKDPNMPSYLTANIDIAVEQFMPDVKMELFNKMRDLFRQDSPPSLLKNGAADDEDKFVQLSPFARLRGHILYHLFPYDRSIWYSLRNPWWYLYTGVGILPVVGQIWWLFLYVIKDKTDEHQLCQFIVGFKAAQFCSLGCFAVLLGVARYTRCILVGSMALCEQTGPMLGAWNAFFFFLQIVLVWMAFLRLPYTVRPRETNHPLLYRTTSAYNRKYPAYHDAFGNEVHMDRGGYLMSLAWYETVVLLVVVVLICLVLWLEFETWQRKALFYWIRTMYGLFSLPFVLFKIPLLATLLMHTKRMGYNARGETVKMVVKAEY